ncbi:MAG: HIT domain-containing protein, partial [Candidatus Eisenbacteria bacterium]|nr:HIT domain-containing protein [Candidatus Eisenbacteria bacterium]
MEPLWTPWRMPYIQGIKSASGCVFCDEVLADGKESDLLLHRGRFAFVVLNLYPYTTGHLMVVPYRHVARFQDLEAAEIEECAALLADCERATARALGTTRQTLGINVGPVSYTHL